MAISGSAVSIYDYKGDVIKEVNPLPVSLRDSSGDIIDSTASGNLQTSVEELASDVSSNSNTQLNVTQFLADGTEGTKITDGANTAAVDGLGTLKTFEPSQIVGESFEGNVLDTNFWTAVVTNDGTVTQDGEIRVETNTTANGTAKVTSDRYARKIPGTVNQFRSVGHFATVPQANNVRTIGVYDDNNGAFFKLDGTTLKIVTRYATTDTEVSSGSFNGDMTSYTIDTDYHRFVIEYTSYIAKFFIDGVLVHKVISKTESWTNSLLLPIRLENNNSGGNTTDNQMHFQLLTILRLGQLRTAKKTKYITGITAANVLKYGAGAVIGLIVSGVVQNANVTLYKTTAATPGEEIFSTGTMGTKTEPFNIDMYGTDFFEGLTITIAAASANVTVVYE